MAYWWVNHKRTRKQEVEGGYLWSPMRNANGRRNQSYDNMTLVRPGDVVFSYAAGYIGAIGTVVEAAAASPKPTEFGSVGNYWSDEGWLVDVAFVDAPRPIRPRDHLEVIRPLLPSIYSPIQTNGNGNQGIYLAGISDALGQVLIALLRVEADPVFASPLPEAPVPDESLLPDIQAIEQDLSVPETQRLQLAKARIGQGLFRKRVMLQGPRCRVTGVQDQRLLIASHIKPWKDCTNAERIDGNNGIMLSPHIDALFDAHLISFEDAGQMLRHASLPMDVLKRWQIDPDTRVDAFSPAQSAFLHHHRESLLAT
jgi:putative restriction endonuclease